MPPRIDATERFLLRLFLRRRYITWCARRRSFAQMQGATNLLCVAGTKPNMTLSP